MANSESTAAVSTPTVKMPMMPLLLSVLAAVVLTVGAVGGAGYMLVRSGRIGGLSSVAAAPVAATKKPDAPTQSIVMDPLLANLADPDGHSYLRLSVVLQVDEPEKKDKKKEDEKEAKGVISPIQAALRDSILDVLGRENSENLLALDGKEHLKHVLMTKFAEKNVETKVREIYFTDFLVQR